METRIRFLIVICIFSLTSFVCMAQLLNDLRKTDVTIILKGDHKQSGQLVNYDPGKSITIVKSNGDTVTYQQSEIYQIKRKRPYIMAFTKEFIETGPQHGYHGEYNFEKISRYRGAMGFSTIQGYQFLPWLRAGVGYIYLRKRIVKVFTFKPPITSIYSLVMQSFSLLVLCLIRFLTFD